MEIPRGDALSPPHVLFLFWPANVLTYIISSLYVKIAGIKLPILFDFTQKSAQVMFEKDRIRIAADFCFDQQCNANTVSENNDFDYYDSVNATSS